MTDPDPDILKSAAAYLLEVARNFKGGRYRKSAKIEALRECPNPALEGCNSDLVQYSDAPILAPASAAAEALRARPSLRMPDSRTACRAVALAKAGGRRRVRERIARSM